MYKRLLCLLLGLLLCCLPALGEEELEMTNDEITRLLWEMYQTENGDIDYTVLPDDYQTPIEGKSGVYNLLLLGIDNPGSAITGRSDTMLLASLNARTGTLKLISFMRDTYVAIPHHGHNKLNAAYAYGGAELLLETLEASFGVQVDGYVAVNYQLMADLVDAIGGVELTVTKDEMKKLNGILEYYNRQREADRSEQLLTEYGDLRLTGLQTMSYARIRKLDNDIQRGSRQRILLQALLNKMMENITPSTLMSLAVTLIPNTSTNLDVPTILQLGTKFLAAGDFSLSEFSVPIENSWKYETKQDSSVITFDAARNVQALHEYIYGEYIPAAAE